VYAEHAGEPGYRAVGAWLGQDLVGFAYGHDARPGQWWREQVAPALAQVGLAGWLDDAYVLVELHLLPAHHGQGLGQALLAGLVGPVTRRRLLLSTDDLDTRARRFYRRNGCLDLLTGFRFSTTRRPFAIMGGLLPLAGPDAGAARYPRG
jgi:GNAT superfamily N-acetyltransferase